MRNMIKILVALGLLISAGASAIDHGSDTSYGQATSNNTKQNMANSEQTVVVNMDMINRINDYQVECEYITLWDVINGSNMEQIRDMVAAYYAYYNEHSYISKNLASSPY